MAASVTVGTVGNTNALRHGVTSERQIAPIARNHRRRLLRQLRLSPRDLDSVSLGYLDLYCRLMSKIELADRYLAEHGLLRADGEPQAVLKVYTSWANSARLSLTRLEAHLGARARSPEAELRDYIDATYGDDDGP